MSHKSILEWEDKVLSKYYLKYGINSISAVQRQNIFDWFNSDEVPKYYSTIIRLTVPMVLRLAENWINSLEKNIIKENDFDIKPVLICSDKFQWVQLLSSEAYFREGVLMRHCVSNFANKPFSTIYSLRDENNCPHITIELEDGLYDPASGMVIYQINQIAGKTNSIIAEKYRSCLVDMLILLTQKKYSVNPKTLIKHNLVWQDSSFIDFAQISEYPTTLNLSNFKGIMPKDLIIHGNLNLHNAAPEILSLNLTVHGNILINEATIPLPSTWISHAVIKERSGATVTEKEELKDSN